jgi:hypothetical protein
MPKKATADAWSRSAWQATHVRTPGIAACVGFIGARADRQTDARGGYRVLDHVAGLIQHHAVGRPIVRHVRSVLNGRV